jgi:tellurite resistance protein
MARIDIPNMMSTIQSPDTSQQTAVWLRGLLTVAWADGHLDPEERALIATLTARPLTDSETVHALAPVSPAELAAILKPDPILAENFLRMAVMVALVDRSYSASEDELLRNYCQALGVKPDVLDLLHRTLSDLSNESPAEDMAKSTDSEPSLPESCMNPSSNSFQSDSFQSNPLQQTSSPLTSNPLSPSNALVQSDSSSGVLEPVRVWLDKMDIHDPKIAHFLCKIIPPQCPFERDVTLFGRKIAHIPAMCKLNPLYEQLVGLRFRALCYLADDCGEDVAPYC